MLTPLLISLLVLFLSVTVCVAEVRLANFTSGLITTVIVFNPTYKGTSRVFLKTERVVNETNTVYLLQVDPSFATGKNAICMSSVIIPTPIGSRGCDGATLAANCAPSDRQAIENALILHKTFYMEQGSSECVANQGNVFSCLGPIWVVRQNQRLLLPNSLVTDEILLDAQGVAIILPVGPRGDLPAVTWVDIEYPKLVITSTNCTDSFSLSFLGGEFAPYYQDEQSTLLLNETRVFKRENTRVHQRIIIKRDWPFDTPSALYLELATADGAADSLFTVNHRSDQTVSRDWLDSLPTTFVFTSGCVASIQINGAVGASGQKFVVKEPPRLNSLNFKDNQFPPPMYFTRVANFAVGRRKKDGTLFYKFLREGELGGGRIKWMTDEPVPQPVRVIPDASYADYEMTCETFWPKCNDVRTYGQGPSPVTGQLVGSSVINAVLAERGICLSEFYDMTGISQAVDPNEAKLTQCYNLGGFTYGILKDVCAKLIQHQKCKKGWVYFQEYCYYKFDPFEDAQFKVSDQGADQVCRQLFDQSEALAQLTRDIKIWLRDRFVLIRRKQPGNPYRVKVTGQRCQAFDYAESPTDSCNDFGTVTDINCNTPVFPLCRYHHTRYYVPHSDVAMHFEDIKVLKEGQQGVPHPGRTLPVQCFDGACGDSCEIACCRVEHTSFNNSLKNFLLLCQKDNRGSCDDGEPRKCQCFDGYGPNGDWLADEEFNKYPCSCASHAMVEPFRSSYFSINDKLYPLEGEQAVCGGTSFGQCALDIGTGISVCQCNQYQVLNPDSSLKFKPLALGRSCNCPTAVAAADFYQLNGKITEGSVCNARGTCCPTGERADEIRLDEQFNSLFGRRQCRYPNGVLITGCACDNGFGGLTCTSPTPKNILEALVIPIEDDNAYVTSLLRFRATVDRVTVDGPIDCPLPTLVETKDGEAAPIACTVLSPDGKEWSCGKRYATSVRVRAASSLLTCSVKAVKLWFPPCGFNGNPYSGRLFANPVYRDYTFHMFPQVADLAPFGSTNTECQYNPDYSGPTGKYGVSAFRYDFDKQDLRRELCGESTNPPRGVLGEDKCDCLKRQGLIEARFTGKACEIDEVSVNGTWLLCAGNGIPIPAQMPYGTCEFDLIEREQDPLNKPFLGFNSAVFNRSQTWTVKERTVIRFSDGRFWSFYPGQLLGIQGLQAVGSSNSTLVAFQNLVRNRLTLNMTYVCQGNQASQSPRLVRPVLQVLEVFFSCDSVVDIGDPSCYETLSYNTSINSEWLDTVEPCPSWWTNPGEIDYAELNWITNYRCLQSIAAWQDIEESEERLLTGFYSQNAFLDGVLEGELPSVEQFAYGVLSCDGFLDRIIAEVAYVRGLVTVQQCRDAAIKTKSNALGEGYGMFHRSMPDLPPFDGPWEESNYRFIGAITNNKYCSNEDGTINYRVFDGETFQKKALKFVDTVEAETDTGFLNSTEVVQTRYYGSIGVNDTSNSSANGLYGNPLIHLKETPDESFTFYGLRPGWMTTVPTEGLIVRSFSLRIPFAGVQMLQVLNPQGEHCATFKANGTFSVGTVINVECGSLLLTVEEEWQTKLRIENAFLPNKTKVEEWVNKYDEWPNKYEITVVWSQEDRRTVNNFIKSDFALRGRSTGYQDLFGTLKTMILRDKTFPVDTVFDDQCLLRTSGQTRTLAELNYSDPEHLAYLKAIYHTHLAVYKCTETAFCKTFARDSQRYRCVFDTEFAVGWRGGDDSVTTPLVGDEGGCECTTGFSKFGCALCVDGYGPETPEDIRWYKTFFNVTETPERCSLPNDPYSTRQSRICGGRGIPISDMTEETLVTINLFDQNRTRRCREVIIQNERLTLDQSADIAVDVIQYRGSFTHVLVLKQKVFVNGTEWKIEDVVDKNVLVASDGQRVECVPWLYSKTHHMKLEPRAKFIDSSSDFWIAKYNPF
jgi:hypothetical protein